MKKSKLIFTSIFLIIGAGLLTWTSCNKKAQYVAPIVPGNEPLTTLELDVVNVNDATDVDTARWVQLNVNGGAIDFSQAHLTLRANASYRVFVRVLDTLTDITPEIKARENFHLVCFQSDTSLYGNFNAAMATTGFPLCITREDLDANNPPLPIGLVDSFVTGADSSAGILEITLHHHPNV